MSIHITGDCHGNFKKFSKKSRLKNNILAGDIVIVCGDFALLWCHDKEFEYNIKFFEGLPITVLWVQGNHENYDMISDYPLEMWNGGYARHIIRDKVILLERGQVFNIEDKKFFTFGGAESHDISDGILDRASMDFDARLKKLKRLKKHNYRILGETWWIQEMPSDREYNAGLINLEKEIYQVDYIITHCAPDKVYGGDKNKITEYFNVINDNTDFNHWYFGHYHDDKEIDSKHTVVYTKFIKLEE